MAFLPRLARCLVLLIALALASAQLRDLPCPDGHHHHHKADCTACCCDCVGCAAVALPESGFAPVQAEAVVAFDGARSMLLGQAPQPEPDPPRPLTLS
jgi:hypothetical protein